MRITNGRCAGWKGSGGTGRSGWSMASLGVWEEVRRRLMGKVLSFILFLLQIK